MIQINCLNRRRIIFSFIISFVLSVVLLSLLSGTSYATGSDEISLQGKIVRNDSGYEGLNVVNGTPACVVSGADTCNFKVNYYSAVTTGTLYYSEKFEDVEIGDSGGIFNLDLGSGTLVAGGSKSSMNEVILSYKEVFLEIVFDPAGDDSYAETFTRTALGTSAYAFGSAADSFSFFNATTTQEEANNVLTEVAGAVYYNTTDNKLRVFDGGDWVSIGSSSGASAWTLASKDLTSYTDHDDYDESAGIGANTGNFNVDVSDDRILLNADSAKGGMSIYSSYNAVTTWPLLAIKADDSSFGGTILELTNDGSVGDFIKTVGAGAVSTVSFRVDNYGDTHLANNGIGYWEPFASDPSSASLHSESGEGCVYSYGGDLYWDSACDSSGEELLNGASGSTLWTDGGTFSYLTSTTDDLVLGASTTGASKFFFDVSEGRLGIGTDTPSAAIDIAGASSEISNGSGDITIIPDDTFVIKANDTEDDVIFMAQDSSGTELFRIDGDSTNIGFGRSVLTANTTGTGNIAVGCESLYYNTTGFKNTAIGYHTLLKNITGYGNTASGHGSLNENTTGYSNTASGYQSIHDNTTGYSNTASGYGSLRFLKPTSGAINAFSDYSGTVAGTVKATTEWPHGLTGTSTKQISGTNDYNGSKSITVIDANNFYFTATWTSTQTGWWAIDSEGRYNTAYGYGSGLSLVTGDSNTFLGYSAGFNASQLTSASNSMALGSEAYTTASNQIILGNTSVTSVGIGTYSPTAHLDVTGISDAIQLKVKGYSSQTSNILEIQTSASADLLTLSNSGTMTLTGNFATGTNNTYDIGTTTARMKDIYAQGDIEIGANGDSGNIRYNTTNDQLEFSNDGSTWIAMADAVKTVTLSAEYAGAVLAADGTTNSGSMTSDAEGSANNSMNYYEWESSETSLQDYDVRLRFTLPSDFSSWGTNAFTFNLATEANSATNNKVDFYVYLESSGSVDGSSTAQYSATAGVWKTTTIAGADLGDCNAAGETCLVLIRMYSGNDSYSRVGDIDINYTREL